MSEKPKPTVKETFQIDCFPGEEGKRYSAIATVFDDGQTDVLCPKIKGDDCTVTESRCYYRKTRRIVIPL